MINIISNQERAKYVFDVIFSNLSIDYSFNRNKKNDLSISYGKNIPNVKGKHIHIFQSDFWDNYKKKTSLPKTPLSRFDYESFKDIIGIFYKTGTKIPIERKNGFIFLNLDIIASIFFLLTRYEEYIQPEIRDKYKRFPANASLAYKENFLNRAIVNEYIELLLYLIRKLVGKLEVKRKKFEIFSTHDIDNFLMYNKLPIRVLAADLVKRKSLERFIERFGDFLKGRIEYRKDHKKDPYWFIDYFIKKEKEIRNAYYFMIGGISKWEKNTTVLLVFQEE